MTIEPPPNDLEERLRAVEDRLEILQLLAAYGPAADSGVGAVAGGLWTDDASYDSGLETFTGRAGVGAMIDGLPLHRELLAQGCTHSIDLPVIDVRGDHATAVGHGFLLRREDDRFVVWRSTAVRWTCERVDGRWRIASRVNRLLDGSSPAREHLNAGLTEALGLAGR
jgi:hypothetical protein